MVRESKDSKVVKDSIMYYQPCLYQGTFNSIYLGLFSPIPIIHPIIDKNPKMICNANLELFSRNFIF